MRIPYGRQWVDKQDISRVVGSLESDWLTTGPEVEAFEREFAAAVGAAHAVAVNSGTMALAAALHAAGIGPRDEVITSPMTFAATANAVLYNGGVPVFADVDERTGLLDPAEVERKIGPKTRAVLTVDYTGNPCDYDRFRSLCKNHGLLLIDDAAHSLGATYKGARIGSIADLTTFSFHPVKHITTGEGGMITTPSAGMADAMRRYRDHGIERNPKDMSRNDGPWYYEMTHLGMNGRLTDFQCALGRAQLKRLDEFVARRRAIAARYRQALSSRKDLDLLDETAGATSSYHLLVVRTVPGVTRLDRRALFERLHAEGILVQVHYIPVTNHPYYQRTFGTSASQCPRAQKLYETCLSLPLFPKMTDEEVEYVIDRVIRILDDRS